jgi:hypothetical protein
MEAIPVCDPAQVAEENAIDAMQDANNNVVTRTFIPSPHMLF